MLPDEAGLKMLKGWHAYTLVCKTGNYFIRMVLSVMSVVMQCLMRTFTPPNTDPEFLAARAQILDFLWPAPRCGVRREARASADHAVARAARRAKRSAELRAEWDLMINGELFTDSLVHHCSPFRCNCKSRLDSGHRISKLLVRTLFFERPRKPELKEWTAIGHSVKNRKHKQFNTKQKRNIIIDTHTTTRQMREEHRFRLGSRHGSQEDLRRRCVAPASQ